ncbi:MAG: hypothetical protein M1828_003266 [Chrysothrix sp. TS-e1954]|nr:MAG: hypothetical protein M1828_003266 [Chrysothrix sp. TS-e1954]
MYYPTVTRYGEELKNTSLEEAKESLRSQQLPEIPTRPVRSTEDETAEERGRSRTMSPPDIESGRRADHLSDLASDDESDDSRGSSEASTIVLAYGATCTDQMVKHFVIDELSEKDDASHGEANMLEKENSNYNKENIAATNGPETIDGNPPNKAKSTSPEPDSFVIGTDLLENGGFDDESNQTVNTLNISRLRLTDEVASTKPDPDDLAITEGQSDGGVPVTSDANPASAPAQIEPPKQASLHELLGPVYTLSAALQALSVDLSVPSTSTSNRFFDHFPAFHQNPTNRILREFRNLAVQSGWDFETSRRNREICLAIELWYWSCNADLREAQGWSNLQQFCFDLGISPVPASDKVCKRRLKAVHVNLIDYVNCKRRGEKVRPVWWSMQGFHDYCAKVGTFVPAPAVRAIPWLYEVTSVKMGPRRV